MAKMTSEERQKFLSELHVGMIAIERADRAPLAVPIWYVYEPGGSVEIWIEGGSVKEKLVRAAGRFTLSVQVEDPPYKYVTVEGPVTSIAPLIDDEAAVIAARYLGETKGKAYAEENLTDGSILISMRPERWLSADYWKDE
jgi:nitroimidazol reductase NimA-like FMN-containing flavoprotein (pyridoxamine 5'-phosphate oxidase superfamily)